MSITDEITHIIINSQILNNRLQNAQANKIFGQKIKNICNNFLNELKLVEIKWYDELFNKKEQSTVDVYNIYDEFMKKISKVPIYDMENISYIIDAYYKDSKSINGICNKILR